MLKFLKIFIYFIYFFKFNIFFLKKNIFWRNLIININKLKMCIDCHIDNNTKNYYLEIISFPIITNQNKYYIEHALILYKNFIRKSFYMNIVSSFLSNLEIKYLSNFFYNF